MFAFLLGFLSLWFTENAGGLDQEHDDKD